MTAFRVLIAGAPAATSRLFDQLSPVQQLRYTPYLVYTVCVFALAAAFLALWATARDYRVFLSMGAYLTMFAAQMAWIYCGGIKSDWALMAWTAPFIVEIAGEAMRVPNRRWTLLVWPVSAMVFILGWNPKFEFLQLWPLDLSQLVLAVLIVQGIRRGQRRDRQIATVFTFLFLVRLTVSSSFTHLTGIPRFERIGPWGSSLTPPAMILLGTATLIIFVRALMEDRREKQRLAAELAAGRAVQQVLIPEHTPEIPGFRFQSVYKPAGEVGGDFFQILPTGHGGVLVAIGDVSGKGMPAAMMVALLVGTLQTLAESTSSPAEILTGLNRRVHGRSHGGFTTCLVLRADADGTVTMANAGHIAPYTAGKEVALENGLPLGLTTDSIYAEMTMRLAAGETLTLLTDGVVEARDSSGALFGFERAAALSIEPAESIAHAAQAFGQEDDITVLTLARMA